MKEINPTLKNNQHLQTCKLTDQGMQRIEFPEFSNIECLVQQSATERENTPPGSAHLWLGTFRAPMGRSSICSPPLWVGCITDEKWLNRPMCLDRQRVTELVSVLQTWLDTGKLVESNTNT